MNGKSLLRVPDIEKVYDEFVSTVQKAIISTVPIRSVYDRSKTPWITKRLKNLSQKKNHFGTNIDTQILLKITNDIQLF